MALVTEPGNAEARAYASVTDLDAYVADYGRSLVDASGNQVTDTAVKEIGLRQGTLFLGFYATRWSGQRASQTQALDFPRINATYRDRSPISSSIIPREIMDANCEAAIQALANPTAFNALVSGREVRREQAGSLSVEYFQSVAGEVGRDTFTAVDDLVSRLLTTDVAATGTGAATGTAGRSFTLAGGSDD